MSTAAETLEPSYTWPSFCTASLQCFIPCCHTAMQASQPSSAVEVRNGRRLSQCSQTSTW